MSRFKKKNSKNLKPAESTVLTSYKKLKRSKGAFKTIHVKKTIFK